MWTTCCAYGLAPTSKYEGSLVVLTPSILLFPPPSKVEGANYLDLTTTLNQDNLSTFPSFKIYRKPAFCGVSIHERSLHPLNHKLAVVHSGIQRALNISMSQADLHKEFETIQSIADLNNLRVNVRLMYRRNSFRQSLIRANSTLIPLPWRTSKTPEVDPATLFRQTIR